LGFFNGTIPGGQMGKKKNGGRVEREDREKGLRTEHGEKANEKTL